MQGGQSQFVRVPLADGTLEGVPEALADDAHDALVLPLTDVFATAYHAVVGAALAEGDAVLVVGDGAVERLACHAACLRSPRAIVLAGHHDDRLGLGRRLGATHVVNTSSNGDLAQVLGDLTDGRGPDAVIDAVLSATSLAMAADAARPAAYVMTGHRARAMRVGEALGAGMVGVNTGQVSCAAAPFGGVKGSGYGRPGGREGIDEYLQTSYMAIAEA